MDTQHQIHRRRHHGRPGSNDSRANARVPGRAATATELNWQPPHAAFCGSQRCFFRPGSLSSGSMTDRHPAGLDNAAAGARIVICGV
jgi:hypothetical protein